MAATAAHCRHEARAALGEAEAGGEYHARLSMVLAALDDLLDLPEMAGDRGRPPAASGRWA